MKKLLIITVLIMSSMACKAQTFEEWFKQKKTQKKYLIQQIAAFQVYLTYLKKGYSIAHKGLATINNIKKGDFNLHRDFFGSLKSINPRIRNYAKVADIIAFQVKVLQVYKHINKQVRTTHLFNTGEIHYIFKVFTDLLSDCADIIDVLITVTATEGFELKDDERLERIDALYSDMQVAYNFAETFGEETKLLAVQRMKDKIDIQTSRIIHSIKN